MTIPGVVRWTENNPVSGFWTWTGKVVLITGRHNDFCCSNLRYFWYWFWCSWVGYRSCLKLVISYFTIMQNKFRIGVGSAIYIPRTQIPLQSNNHPRQFSILRVLVALFFHGKYACFLMIVYIPYALNP